MPSTPALTPSIHAMPSATPPTAQPPLWPADWPICHLHTPQGDTAAISLHGAQVLSWRTADNKAQQERLYLSPRVNWQAVAQGRSAIRGGIPICWPQFNRRGPLPKHGLARLLPWGYYAVITPAKVSMVDGHGVHEYVQVPMGWIVGFLVLTAAVFTVATRRLDRIER